MMPLLIFFLAGSFFIQPTDSLKCYTCNTQVSNDKCRTEKACDIGATYCKTDIINVISSFNIISKECSSDCKSSLNDFSVGKRNVSCCSTNLCNLNGAHTFGLSYLQVALTTLISLACIILGNKL